MKDHNQFAEDGNLFEGLFWATLLSIPLWISFFGWIKIFINSSFPFNF